jgi:hypothetical protein
MTARQRHHRRTRQIQRARQGERAHRSWVAWMTSLRPFRCEGCGERGSEVDWHDGLRGWFHPACAVVAA